MHTRSFLSGISTFYGRLFTLALFALLISGCGSDSNGNSEYRPLELRELVRADEANFDVDWRSGTLVATEDTVLEALDDLQPSDGIFRVSAESPLLDGVSVGSIVVWPQVGIFEILDLNAAGDVVEVKTKWAVFSDAASRAEIDFKHELRAGEVGRAVGAAPASALKGRTTEGLAVQPLTVGNGPLSFSEDGVNYQAEVGGATTGFSIDGNSISASFSSNSGGTTVSLSGKISGLTADGKISLLEGEDDAAVRLDFKNVHVEIQATLSVNGAKGTASVVPPAQLVFPFVVGPMPVYIAIGTDIEIESTIGTTEGDLSASAGFTMDGSISVGRNRDGSFGADGEVKNFATESPQFSFDTTITAGIAIRFSAPRISFGIGRPGMASTSIYGKQSVEFITNTVIDPFASTYCAQVSSSAASFVGGELSLLGWVISKETQVAFREGIKSQKGKLCP